ncbi:AfsA-related hotdog domain-containing protein [Streptomyces sp. NPDC003015]
MPAGSPSPPGGRAPASYTCPRIARRTSSVRPPGPVGQYRISCFLRHPLDRTPGMLLLEAARQAVRADGEGSAACRWRPTPRSTSTRSSTSRSGHK